MHTIERVRPTQSRRAAFTLAELATCTVALTLLLSQVVPAVKNARGDSLLTGCKDRMGRIAAAGLVYASEDASEFATPIGVADGDPSYTGSYTMYYNYGGKSGLGPGLDANQSLFAGPLGMGAMHRPLNRILYKEVFGLPPIRLIGRLPKRDWNRDGRHDLDVYHCPADGGFSGMHYQGWKDSGRSAYDYFGTSYITSVLVVAPTSVSTLSTVSSYRRPLSTIPYPAATILYQELAAQFAKQAYNPNLDQSGCGILAPWAEYVANGWHGTAYRFAVAFSDGAVGEREIKGFGRVQPPLYDYSYRCLYVRGDGWRMDTFPAPLLSTTKPQSAAGDPAPEWAIVE